jgi:hypothetical protein
MATRKWTDEQRRQQSLRIRRWQPWKHSTGPRTNEGKAITSLNAFKGGLRASLKLMAKFLRDQRDYINDI